MGELSIGHASGRSSSPKRGVVQVEGVSVFHNTTERVGTAGAFPYFSVRRIVPCRLLFPLTVTVHAGFV